MKFILLFFAAAACFAQTAAVPPSITAVGQASISTAPDLARIDLGVITEAADAQNATAQNATKTTAVIAALRKLLGAESNIKTTGYSVSPVYKQNGSITGYRATNIVETTLTDLTETGKVIDTAIQSGANRVQSISFDVKDRTPFIAQALKLAAAKARAQAEAIAAGLNVHTGPVLHASESVSGPVRFFPSVAQTVQVSTPIETGEITIEASVTVELAITK
jgi:uncharacterized protein